MTTSLVAVVTDVMRDGRPVIGCGFNSNGHGRAAPPVFVYATGGYHYPGKDDTAPRRVMRSCLDRGYSAVKMKIGGAPLAEDRRRIEAVLAEIGSQSRLAVNTNGRFDLQTAVDHARVLRNDPLF